jgi:hypothetical protein
MSRSDVMRELTTGEIEQVSGGVLRFIFEYFATKVVDEYIEYYKNPEPLFTNTEATLQYGNSFGMY